MGKMINFVKKILLVLFLFSSASLLWAYDEGPLDSSWQVGDVILLPLNCFLCRAIELETDSPYSHSGVVLKNAAGEWVVAEALGSVRLVPLASFLKRGPQGRPYGHYRLEEWAELAQSKAKLRQLQDNMLTYFNQEFAGAAFDHQFLWDNKDSTGREEYYCSEFVAKFLNHFVQKQISPVPMNFTRSWDYWLKFFNGDVPQGKLGLAPGDLAQSNLLQEVSL